MNEENNQNQVPEEQDNIQQNSEESPIDKSLEQKSDAPSELLEEKTIETPIKETLENQKKNKKKIIIIAALALAAFIVVGIIIYIISKANDDGWFSNQMLAFYIAAGLITAGIVAWLILRKTFRTRLKMEKIMKDDPDIDDYLVIYSLTPKALYFPTIIFSFIAAILMNIPSVNVTAIGGIWFAIFFLNFLVEEYNISIKISLIFIVSTGFFLLWLHLIGKVMAFLGFFKNIAISMNAAVYLLVGILGLVTIFISWLRGMFYYITLTPNYMNLQDGPTESGEQIGREDYNTRIDTSDILERLMGFGRIIISFKDRNKEPISVLVWRIKSKAESLERVRGKLAIDHVSKKMKNGI
ncbi:MAG: YIP1 family protein [Sedimentisphaerales bacterium]|nr:YIP1 family protein [Sedimentisphaerales bacterium]